jgi:dipeptidyl aminopeptidase/acylaminoacyl peptidase
VRVIGAAAALLTVAGAAGCFGNGPDDPAPVTVQAPPQASAHLVAIRGRYDGERTREEVVTLADDGSDVRVLTMLPDGALQGADDAAWAPDAATIFFTAWLAEREGQDYSYRETDLFAVEADGSGRTRLTRSGDAQAPSPAPDGKTIVFTRREHQGIFPFNGGLWLTDTGGGEAERFVGAKEGQIDVPGSWSPGGETLAFTRCTFALPEQDGLQRNTCSIYRVDRDGSGLKLLAERASAPAYSPDGEQIAFVSDRDENGLIRTGSDENAYANELYVMAADGGDQRRLTSTESLDEETPSWAPDGARLAYGREGPSSFAHQLMVVDADGSCPAVIAGQAMRSALSTPDFGRPMWRPGRILGPAPRRECK